MRVFIKVKFEVFNPTDPRNRVQVEGVVDTGAIYSVIPRKTLSNLGEAY